MRLFSIFDFRFSIDLRIRQNLKSKIQNPKSGQALIPVLFVVLILTAVAVTMATTSKRETRSAGNQLRELQQYYIARGAINYAASELEQATNGGTSPPQLQPPPDTDANGWTQLGDGWYKLEIIDTGARVNINIADAATLNRIPLFQQDPNLVAAIIDWRDADDNPSSVTGTNGAGTGVESDYYQSLNPSYFAKNAPFDSIDELMLVRGITPQMLYSQPDALNSSNPQSDTSAYPGSRQGTGGTGGAGSTNNGVSLANSSTPLYEQLTTYSRELNMASDGTARVNLKTASQQDLQNKLGMNAQQAQRLVSGRGNAGANLTSVADLLDASKFQGFNRQFMQQYGDKITVTDSQYRNGLININTAPAEVLAAIPGVDQTTYNAIVQAREGGTVFTGMNDLYQLTSLNATQLRNLVDHVCTKSSVYIVRVKVRMNGTNKVYAAQALVELTAPQASTDTTGTGGTGATGTTGSTTDTEPLQPAKILQWRVVPKNPGWGVWITPPSYTSANSTTSTNSATGTTGGTVGNP